MTTKKGVNETEVNVYQTKSGIARTFGISRQTVYNALPGLKEQIKKGRYTKYAMVDNLIHIGVFADYMKYRKWLDEDNARKYVPPFDLCESLKLFQK